MTSPCIKVCILDGDVCVGCRRTIDEIIAWGSMSDVERETVLIRLAPTRNPGEGALPSIIEGGTR